MRPNLKAINKKINKVNEILIRTVKALTVRLESPGSRTRKNKPLAREPAIIIMTKMINSLVIICYTPEIAIFSQELANLIEQLINDA
jgi:hypothetical protein